MDLEKRFWSKVNILNDDSCWEWIAGLTTHGYGNFKYLYKSISSNRMVWFLLTGEFPDLHVLHTCDNRKCCNPKHLFLGTNLDNIQDRVSKNRSVRLSGEKNGFSRLTNNDILFIRDSNLNNNDLALKYKVSNRTIRDIKSHRSWKHI